MIKALIALGLTAAAIEALSDALVLIGSAIFTEVVLKIVVEGATKAPVRELVKEIAEKTLKEAGPKVRVLLTEEVRHRVAQRIGEEVEHLVEELTKNYVHVR